MGERTGDEEKRGEDRLTWERTATADIHLIDATLRDKHTEERKTQSSVQTHS